ncbi:MAG: hypothetical protein ACLRM8_04890 [Alistipes sp.]
MTLAAEYGVTAIVQPGGRCATRFGQKADEKGIAMVFTGESISSTKGALV